MLYIFFLQKMLSRKKEACHLYEKHYKKMSMYICESLFTNDFTYRNDIFIYL